jgi:hypothetical protein
MDASAQGACSLDAGLMRKAGKPRELLSLAPMNRRLGVAA